jgi:hypothetical protein
MPGGHSALASHPVFWGRDQPHLPREVTLHPAAACLRVVRVDDLQMSAVRYEPGYPDAVRIAAMARVDHRLTAQRQLRFQPGQRPAEDDACFVFADCLDSEPHM